VVREKKTELGEEDAWFPKVVYFGKGKGAPKFKMVAMYPPNLNKMNRHYHCSHNQSTGCNAHLELTIDVSRGEATWVLTGGHTKECIRKNGISAHVSSKMGADGCPAEDLYKLFVRKSIDYSLEFLYLSGRSIWDKVREELLDGSSSAVVKIPGSKKVCAYFLLG
jgi:hypothetical protein